MRMTVTKKRQTDNTQWTDNTQSWHGAPVIHRFTRGLSGLRQNEAPAISNDFTSLGIFMLFFLEIIHLLVEETNRHYWIYFDTLDKGWSPLPDVTIQEMYSFLAIIVQMGHDQKDMMKAYWNTAEQFSMFFYGKMKQDRFYHILRFLHFSDNKNRPDKKDKLWKMKILQSNWTFSS